MNAIEVIDFINDYLVQDNPLNSEMKIYDDNLFKLSQLKEILINNQGSELLEIVNMDIQNIQNFISCERVITSSVESKNGDYETISIANINDYIQRIDFKELVRLGTIYFLMLIIDLKKVMETKRGLIPLIVNAMRNRSYEKMKLLMQTLLHQSLINRLNQYISDNKGDMDNKTRIITLKLSQYINKNEISFANEAELDQFIDNFIKNEVNSRIGEKIDNTNKKSLKN